MRTPVFSVCTRVAEVVRAHAGPRSSYWLLTLLVLIFLASHAWNQRWGAAGDFWQHSAVVRELSLNPWSPTHPYLHVEAAHEFYSPYSLALGLLSRLSGLGSIHVLSVIGVINFVFLSWSLRRFCLRLSSQPWCSFFTLLFTLVLWGYNPWMFSGFFHLAAIGDTAPNPSCFCAALTFLAWSICVDYADRRTKFTQPLLLSLIMFAVFVSHPHTAVALCIGLLALWCGIPGLRRNRKTLVLGASTILALSLSFVWPYYSLYHLLTKSGAEHQAGNQWMYAHVLRSTFAGLVFVPCVIGRIRRKWQDPIGLMFVMFIGIYALGYASGKYALGRIIVYVMFCLHSSAGDWFARDRIGETSNRSEAFWHRLAIGAATMLVLTFTVGFFAVGVYRYRPGRDCTYAKYLFLPDYVSQDDIVLTDLVTSTFVPSFAGKVAATSYIAAFADDNAERQEATDRFFSRHVESGERWTILSKYHVGFILLDRNRVPSRGLQEEICSLGSIVYSADDLLLIDLKSSDIPNKRMSQDDEEHSTTDEVSRVDQAFLLGRPAALWMRWPVRTTSEGRTVGMLIA